jgi:hypothetical protein
MTNKQIVACYLSYILGFSIKNTLILPWKNIFYNNAELYSYGYHFTLAKFSAENKTLYINKDKYSRTTSKHTTLVLNTLEQLKITQKFNVKICSFSKGEHTVVPSFIEQLIKAKGVI